MDEYAVVINAGSSSLKFCVFRRPDGQPWLIETRGQIEGIGTAPRFTAKDGDGKGVLDRQLDASVNDGRKALGAVADWLGERYGGSPVRRRRPSHRARRREVHRADNRHAGSPRGPARR